MQQKFNVGCLEREISQNQVSLTAKFRVISSTTKIAVTYANQTFLNECSLNTFCSNTSTKVLFYKYRIYIYIYEDKS